LNKKDKDRYQKKLLEIKKENNQKLIEFFHESQEVDDSSIAQDIGDKAESSYTKEFLLSLSDSERKKLLLVDEALTGIKENTYGKCQMCGVDIGRKRLSAVPWASLCFKCQEKAEKETS
jgi:DnaK suppressor protein